MSLRRFTTFRCHCHSPGSLYVRRQNIFRRTGNRCRSVGLVRTTGMAIRSVIASITLQQALRKRIFNMRASEKRILCDGSRRR